MNILLIIAIILAIIEWIGEDRKIQKMIYSTKPLVLITLLIWIFSHINLSTLFGYGDLSPILWFIFGIYFCLIGDILLMLPEKFFMPGLFIFLGGHIFYIIGFGRIFPPERNFIPGFIIFSMILLVSGNVYLKLAKGLKSSGKTRMRIPVAIYALVISLMLFSALISLLDREWNYIAALWVSFGSLSFYISDIMNAWMRFVKPIPKGRLKIMMSYHLAQIAIVIGVVLHFVYPPDS
jgi:alkenylglycerophosphocholine/alkenylglycerophosphoethanolamine hydrolase